MKGSRPPSIDPSGNLFLGEGTVEAPSAFLRRGAAKLLYGFPDG
jgi:hypothetical protein